jgi:sugar transferase (PEP-CTERM/EpsH1 system associated)
VTDQSSLLVAHVVHRFDVGGLENGVVNLINGLPRTRFRHAVVSLTEVTRFRERVERDDVEFIALNKPPGQGFWQFPSLARIFRRLRPDIVHTRNLAPLEACVPARLAGVRVRIHGEHGWDVGDLRGENRKHRWIRRAYRPFVTHYVALSKHQQGYLEQAVGVPAHRVSQIYNGVDTRRFRRDAVPAARVPSDASGAWVVGSVGRLVAVKDQAALVRALAAAWRRSSEARRRMRLAIVGDGPLRDTLADLARSEGVEAAVALLGERNDVAAVLRGLDAFALPSLAEGISNTLLEAMSSSLPVVATAVGGNVELVDDQVSGTLVPPSEPAALVDALLRYFCEPETAARHAGAARRAVEQRFSLDRMVADYAALYERTASSTLGRGNGVELPRRRPV